MNGPLIGITAASFHDNGKLYHRSYAPNAAAIAAAGGLPVYIPPGLPGELLQQLYARLDGLLLPGGPDVRPTLYGQAQHPKSYGIDDPRDALELTLARWAVTDDLPLLGICRGHQVLNVALGGTLMQDIPSQWQTTLTHDLPDGLPRATRLHEVAIAPDSHLAAILGVTHAPVNSLHHQSVQEAAPGARVTASAPDGIVEALEVPGKQFALSVQWHPEDLYGEDPAMARLFVEFVAAAAQFQLTRLP